MLEISNQYHPIIMFEESVNDKNLETVVTGPFNQYQITISLW